MKKTFFFRLSHIFLLSMTLLSAGVELDYLNALRTKTGMPALSAQANLIASAQNHSAYMETNNVSGHYEDSTKTGFTGVTLSDRVAYAGYTSKTVGENVSYGTRTVQGSIDGLFSAIYHRFGFLSFSYDDIGIGISNNNLFYTYDLGSSNYTSVSANNKSSSPDLILWPPSTGNDIPPVFYEESPDPLPSDGVTGYPVSVEFNKGTFTSAPTVSSFTLQDESGIQLSDLARMTAANDPAQHFDTYQFALFPEKRLEWGSRYQAEIIYNYNGIQKSMNWCFTTRSLQNKADKFYRITNNADISLNVVSGKTYAIYVVPNDTNDKLGNVNYSYTSDVPTFSYIDSNTISIRITGATGRYVSFTCANGQKITLTIATTDAATNPTIATCTILNDFDKDGFPDSIDTDDDNDGVLDIRDAFPFNSAESVDTDGDGIGNNADIDDDNDGIIDTLERANGLNPLNPSDAQADFDHDGFSNSIEISVGANIYNAASKPKWVPVMVGDIFILIPSFDK